MQVSPSVSLLQALSTLFQTTVTRPQGGGKAPSPPAAAAPAANGRAVVDRQPAAVPTPTVFEPPPPGTPIRRGMLLNILA